jgi:hypothetical protein
VSLYGGSDYVDHTPNGCVQAGGSVTDLVLRGGGATAFVDVRWDQSLEVLRADRRGVRVLAHGPAIEPTSLTLHGDRIAWRDAGVARSASLGARPPSRQRSVANIRSACLPARVARCSPTMSPMPGGSLSTVGRRTPYCGGAMSGAERAAKVRSAIEKASPTR